MCGGRRSGTMQTISTHGRIASVVAVALALAAGACGPKKDTAPPDPADAVACPEDAQVCEDGSSVSREGPDCEFAACPESAEPESTPDDADAEAEPASDEAAAEESPS